MVKNVYFKGNIEGAKKKNMKSSKATLNVSWQKKIAKRLYLVTRVLFG
jgi:hypothetical protein